MIAEERPEIPLFIVAGATKRDLVVETTAGAAGRDTSIGRLRISARSRPRVD